jgi:hypothetical protein
MPSASHMSSESVSASSGDRGPVNTQPEGYTWPLVAILIAIVPQVLVPARDRLGPPLVVPIIEAAAFLSMLVIAALPGPVPARARPVILLLFSVLTGANAVAAGRLVILVLEGGKIDGALLSAIGCWSRPPSCWPPT